MPLHQLRIESWGCSSYPRVAVRIRRLLDNFLLDIADLIFKNEAECENPFLPLRTPYSTTSPNTVEFTLEVNPQQFTDGDYLIYYHNIDQNSLPNAVYGMSSFVVQEGAVYHAAVAVPTPTQVAARVLDAKVPSHIQKDSVGYYLQEINNKLDVLISQSKTIYFNE